MNYAVPLLGYATHRLLLEVGVVDVPLQLQPEDNMALTSASRAAVSSQPCGKKFRPLMREYSCIVTLRAPQDSP